MRIIVKRTGSRGALLALLLVCLPAWAQEPSLERRIEGTQKSPRLAPPSEDELIVLRPKKSFTLQSYSSLRFTDNAFLSDQRRVHDRILAESLTASAATQIAGKFDVFADAGFLFARYDRNRELDYDAVYARFGAVIPVDSANLYFTYSPLLAYDRGFGNRTLASHGFEVRLTRDYLLRGRIGLNPYIAVSRHLASPDDFEQTVVRIGTNFSYSLRGNLYVFGSAEGTYRRYGESFEEFTRRMRRDSELGVLIGLAWSPREWATLYIMSGANRLSSTVDANSYTELFATPALSLHLRF